MIKKRNTWHHTMYDSLHASTGLDSSAMRKRAADEVKFVLRATSAGPGTMALDVPCGTGRHSILMADAGLDVTGIDISKACINLAKKNSKRRSNLKFRVGDMAHLDWARGKFDLVCNLFSSFGYFSTDEENLRCLKGMIKALRPGGQLVIQTINRDFLLKIFDPARWGDDGKMFWLESTRYDSKTKYVESQKILIPKKTQNAHRYYFRMRLYSVPEMKRLMLKAGLHSIQVYGGPDGSRVNKTKSTHPIYNWRKYFNLCVAIG